MNYSSVSSIIKCPSPKISIAWLVGSDISGIISLNGLCRISHAASKQSCLTAEACSSSGSSLISLTSLYRLFLDFIALYWSNTICTLSRHSEGSSYSVKWLSYNLANGQMVPETPGSELDDESMSTLPKWDGCTERYAELIALDFSSCFHMDATPYSSANSEAPSLQGESRLYIKPNTVRCGGYILPLIMHQWAQGLFFRHKLAVLLLCQRIVVEPSIFNNQI